MKIETVNIRFSVSFILVLIYLRVIILNRRICHHFFATDVYFKIVKRHGEQNNSQRVFHCTKVQAVMIKGSVYYGTSCVSVKLRRRQIQQAL